MHVVVSKRKKSSPSPSLTSRLLRLVLVTLFAYNVLVTATATEATSSSNQIIDRNVREQIDKALSDQLLRSILEARGKNETGILNQTPGSAGSSKYALNLADFQTDLVRKRNAECLFEKHQRFEWSAVEFKPFNRSILDLYRPAQNLTQHFINELSKKVIRLISFIFSHNFNSFYTLGFYFA